MTSQLFANIYLNELDQFIKHKLKIKHYLRYCDDFVILDNDPVKLEKLVRTISGFLRQELKLSLHENKVSIRKLGQGIDFLGYVVLPHHRVLMTKTKKRIISKIDSMNQDFINGKISEPSLGQSVQSYLGALRHCEGYKIKKEIQSIIEGR